MSLTLLGLSSTFVATLGALIWTLLSLELLAVFITVSLTPPAVYKHHIYIYSPPPLALSAGARSVSSKNLLGFSER